MSMRRPILISALVLTLLALIAFAIFYFVHWRFIESTEDAYVNGNQVVVTSQVSGFLQGVYVQDTQLVQAGDLLVTLDKTDPTIALELAQKQLANVAREYIAMVEKVSSLEAEKQIRNSEFIKTGQDFVHRQQLLESGAVSIEDYEHAEAAFTAAFAATLLTEHNLRAAQAQVEGTTVDTHPTVMSAKQAVRQAYVNLKRCDVRAPVSGMVARKGAQVGESIAPSDPLLTIVPFDQMWVDANYKEVQLKCVQPGLPVTMHADLYGRSVIYHGVVLGINAGTGSVFSVLPPQNATGNWIKIVQRLAVRVALDPEEVKKHPLRLGLSMDVKLDVRRPLEEIEDLGHFETSVFAEQLEGVEEMIAQIIRENT